MVILSVLIKKPFQDETRIWAEFNRVLGFRGEVVSLFRMKETGNCEVVLKTRNTWQVADEQKEASLRSWIPAKLRQLEVISIFTMAVTPEAATPPRKFHLRQERVAEGQLFILGSQE